MYSSAFAVEVCLYILLTESAILSFLGSFFSVYSPPFLLMLKNNVSFIWKDSIEDLCYVRDGSRIYMRLLYGSLLKSGLHEHQT